MTNCRARLPRRHGGGMAAYDRLPPALRHWLSQAVLPWSPAQALRIWQRHADPQHAVAALTQAERLTLQREVARNRRLRGSVVGHVQNHDPATAKPPPA